MTGRHNGTCRARAVLCGITAYNTFAANVVEFTIVIVVEIVISCIVTVIITNITFSVIIFEITIALNIVEIAIKCTGAAQVVTIPFAVVDAVE